MPFTSTESAAVFQASAPRYPVEALGRTPASVLEVGAGSGGGTRHLLETLPGVPVTALEPDDAARNALVWHLVAAGAVTDDLTVLPLRLADAPGRHDLVVCHHVVCQVDPGDRPAFWADVRDHLTDDGVALVDAHLGTATASAVPRRLSAEGHLGAARYRRWFTATPVDGAIEVHQEYEILAADGTLLHREERRSRSALVSEEEDLAVVADAGLVAERLDGWFALRRS